MTPKVSLSAEHKSFEAAPNIYYLGNNGVITFGGLRIAGLSGIFKGHDYHKGWNEKFPLDKRDERSNKCRWFFVKKNNNNNKIKNI